MCDKLGQNASNMPPIRELFTYVAADGDLPMYQRYALLWDDPNKVYFTIVSGIHLLLTICSTLVV